MSNPTEGSWRKLLRVAKYLIAKPRLIMKYDWQEPLQVMTTCSDANWAGCLQSRKSTSGGSIMIGSHLIKTWSKTQANIALSSAESEFYATLKAAQESLGIIALAKEFSLTMTVSLQVDASAALGVAQRVGIGKIRHLQTGALWLQEQQLRKSVNLGKMPGANNPSDIITKNVARELLEKHMAGLGGVYAEGRAVKAVNLQHINRLIRQTQADIRDLKKHDVAQQHVVEDNMVNMNIHNFESFLCDAEFQAVCRLDEVIKEWKGTQCKQMALSRKSLLQAATR